MTTGIVSALGRTITESTSNYAIADVIQTSAPINSGNSGGPLLNDNGQVVGITTAIVSGSTGVGFAIPSDTILREITSLVDTGSYSQHPWLGIAWTDMTYDIAKAMNLNVTYGVLIEQVTSGGPAAKSGLKAGTRQAIIDGTSLYVGGDVIVAINGVNIVNFDSLSMYLEENILPNQTILCTIIRNSQLMTVSVTLGTRPAS
jgi:S1-C subfamily serine protease